MMPDGDRDSPQKGHAPTVSFREGRQEDIPECARLAKDAWPAGPGHGSNETELSGMAAYMQYSFDSSNWAEVACIDEIVVGFLFGRIDGHPEAAVPKRSLLGEVPALAKSIMDHEIMGPKSLRFVWSLAMTEMKLRLNTPPSEASIEMFIVDAEHRGRGIGSALLDRFLGAARDARSSTVTLYTDETMSNWRFYEGRGFKKVATFHDNITSLYSEVSTRGIVYAMDLKTSPVSAR